MIKYRITRCEPIQYYDDGLAYKHVAISVDADDIEEQVSHHITLTSSQCLGKTNEECVDLAFKLMSGSISNTVNKLKNVSSNIVGAYYIPS